MSPETIARIERYAGIQTRIVRVTERMHHNLAGGCDLDGLERLAAVLERVALDGDRVEVTTAQAVAAKLRAAAAGVSGAMPASPPGEAAGGEIVARMASTPETDGPEALVGETGDGAETPAAGTAGPLGSAGEGEATALTDPAAGVSAVILRQKPPIAKPGRTRGWQGSGGKQLGGEGDGE